MREKKGKSKVGTIKYLPVLLILLSITIMVGSTFAYFTDRKDTSSDLTFSKVELSSDTSLGIDGVLFDVIPGSKIVDGAVAFSKAIDSEAIYVRAKVSFSLDKNYTNDNNMKEFIKQLRNATDFNIVATEQNGAVWSAKDGNYFYLMEAIDEGAPTNLKRVDTIDTYTLSNEMVIPRNLKQLEGNAQYMKSINFHIAFEAIQADNVSNVLEVTKVTFDEMFPISADEKPGIYVSVMNSDLMSVKEEIMLTNPIKIEEPEMEDKIDEDGTTTHIFDGWYTDATFTTAFDFDSVITSSVSLYPKFLEVSEGLAYSPIYESATNNAPDFTERGEGEAQTIIGYSVAQGTCDDSVIVLPLEYMGKPIIEIASSAFTDNENLTNIYLPDTITTIETNAFDGCKNLVLTALPNGVTSIGSSAFEGCENITLTSLPSGITTIEEFTFSGCKNIALTSLSNEITSIGYGAFQTCEKLTLTALPSNLVVVRGFAFSGCKNIALTSLPSGVTSIEHYAFQSCYNLAIEELPSGLLSIAENAFEFCDKLELKSIPDGVISIGENAFKNCSNFKLLTLPTSLTEIGVNAFSECSNLEYLLCASKEVATCAFGKGVEEGNIYYADINGYESVTFTDKTVGDKTIATGSDGTYKWVKDGEVYYKEYVSANTITYMNVDLTSVYTTVEVEDGNVTLEQTPPTHSDPNAVFEGWYLDSALTSKFTFGNTLTSDITLYPKYDFIYQVVFMLDGETYNSQDVMLNGYPTDPEDPSKDGYEFDGWTINGTNLVIPSSLKITTNVTFNAVFTKLHTVTFTYEGSTQEVQTIRNGNKPTNVDAPSTTYKVFNGWKLNGNIVDETLQIITSDTTFEADITYKYDVVFMVDSTTHNSQIVTLNSYPSNPTNPTKSGYEFDGWTLNGSIVTPSSTKITGATTFTAKFTQLFTVTFTYEGSTYATQTIRNGNKPTNVDVTSTTYKVFNGWKLNGTIVTVANQTITANTTFVADITYKYDVKFMVDGNTHNSQIATLNSYPTNPTNPTKSGYEFDGWLLNGNIVTPSSTKITGNTTFTAKFTQLFTVTFTYEGSTYATQTIRNGNKPTNVDAPSTTYKVFNGWKLNGTIVTVANQTITANTTFVADITYKYDVKFMVDGNTHNSQIVIKGGYPTLPQSPSKVGYEFDGWSANGVDIVNISTYLITTNTTFVGMFTEIILEFSTASWEEISNMSSAGLATKYFAVGDEKDVKLSSGEVVTVVILGFNHDNLSDGSGKAGISIGMKQCLGSTHSLTTNWVDSSLRKTVMEEIFSQLPKDLQSEIKTVNKKSISRSSSGSSQISSSNDKLFILSLSEIYSVNNIANDSSTSSIISSEMLIAEGSQYEYFSNIIDPNVSSGRGNELLIRYLSNGGGNKCGWLTRSTFYAYGMNFTSGIWLLGQLGGYIGDENFGGYFCFCV